MTTPAADLYDHLGIPRDADAATIRRAYYRRAKSDHPDAGGDRRSFALTTLAKDILSDPDRRAKYDRTGDADAASIDNTASEIMQIVVALIEAIINSYAHNGVDPVTINIPAEALKLADNKLREGARELAECNKRLAKERRFLNRFKRKTPGDNVLDKIMHGRVKPYEEALRNVEQAIVRLKAAVEIIKEYEFEADKAAAPAYKRADGWFIVNLS